MIIKRIQSILHLNIPDRLTNQAVKLMGLLENIEAMATSPIDKEEVSDIKGKVKQATEMLQESFDDLYALSERLQNEKEQPKEE